MTQLTEQATTTRTYRMTTEIPAAITMPDVVETQRLGTLRFADGFPDTATVTKVFDNLDFQRAVQAYLQGIPAVQLVGMRTGLLQWGPVNQTVLIWEQLMDPHTLFGEANANTVYWAIWADTRDGPVVLEIPPQVLGFINDVWSRWVVDLGITGPDQGQGGKYLLLPPGYSGPVPEGYFVARPPTFNLLVAMRTFLVDGDPRPGIERGKAHLRIYPLAQADNPPQPRFVNVSEKPCNFIGPSDYTAFEALNQVIQDEPVEATDPNTRGLLASIGIKKGQPFAPDARLRTILEEAAKVGHATARAITYRYRDPSAYSYPHSAWRSLFLGGGYRFEQDGVRLWDAYISLYFGGIGVSPAEDVKMVGKGSQYVLAFVDAQGAPLDGGKTYRLHLPPNIPAKDFWSVILYDTQTRSMLQTDQRLPMVSSQTQGLAVNADTSVDVYFGPEPPAGKEHNWAQTIPGKGWYAALRLYGPLEPWFDQTWRPGEIEPVAYEQSRPIASDGSRPREVREVQALADQIGELTRAASTAGLGLSIQLTIDADGHGHHSVAPEVLDRLNELVHSLASTYTTSDDASRGQQS